MTEQELLQAALQGLTLTGGAADKLLPADQQQQGQAQGQALLKLLQGHTQQQPHNGYEQGGAAGLLGYGSGGAVPAPAAPLPPPPQRQPQDRLPNGLLSPQQPEQAVSSLFGAGSSSIWSSGSHGQGHLGGDLWGNPPPGAIWPQQAPPPAVPQQQQVQEGTAPYHHAPRQPGPPPYQPPMQFAPQQQPQPPHHPALRGQQLAPAPHLPTQQQQPYSAQQQGQAVQQQLAPHLQQRPYGPPLQPPPQQQARPVIPYSPLSALLQPGAMPPQHLQQPQQQQQQHLQQQQQQQQAPPPVLPPQGAQAGPWGPGALFAGLPAMQHLQPQPAARLPPMTGMPLGATGLPPPPLSPRSQLQPPGFQQQQQPGQASLPPALFGGNHVQAAQPPLAPSTAGTPSPPPLPQHEQQQQQQEGQASSRQGAAARKPGTQNAAKAGSGRENRWVDVMDRSHDGRQPKADMAQLNAALTQLADSLMPTPEERAAQMEAFSVVKSLLQARYPGAGVHLFGSVANGLSVRHNNDIDVCLELAGVDDQAGKSDVAVAVGELMEAAGMGEVLPLPKARVPVVKFVVPRTGTKVDVTVNNLLACINTKLLADYCAIDGRLAPLVALVKHWAKQRAVNDPYRGTLSSYCYVLMCIHLLQSRPQPVLPVLQALPPTFRRTVGQWTCEFCDDVASLRGFGAANHESLAHLLWAFFEYWAWRHNYSHDVVSVRLGRCLHKDDKDWTRRIGNERHLVCIEDPFELSHDLGRTVDRQTRAVLHKEFTRAATLLRDSQDPLDLLFQPYRVGSRG